MRETETTARDHVVPEPCDVPYPGHIRLEADAREVPAGSCGCARRPAGSLACKRWEGRGPGLLMILAQRG